MTARSKKSTQPKDNAKGRRKKENTQLLDLAAQLPLPPSVASQLDKASVIRLATAYLKLRKLFPRGLGREWGEGCSPDGCLTEMGKFLNKALHGFVFVLGSDATILYISEEASAQLGYSQVQLTGKNFWSYVHSTDAKELKPILSFGTDISSSNIGNCSVEDAEVPRSFAVRMKCILPKRQAELTIDRYKVIHCRGYLKLKRKAVDWDSPSDICYEVNGVVAAGHSLSPTPSAELKLLRRDFMFRTGLSLKFIYIEPGSQQIIGYEPLQLQDKSLYKFIHPYDCKKIEEFHSLIVKKTQAVSSYYRFLTQSGGWIWMQSSCIVIANNKIDRDQCILFINSVLSEREYPNRMLDMEQLPAPSETRNSPYKKSQAGYKNKRKTPYHLQKEPSTIHPTFNSSNSQGQSTPHRTSEVQVLDKKPKLRSVKPRSHSPESDHVLESRQSANGHQNPDLLQKDNSYISNHDRSVAFPRPFTGVNTLGELEMNANLPLLPLTWLDTLLYGSFLTKDESSLYAKLSVSAGEHETLPDSEISNKNQSLESSSVSPIHSNLINEHSTMNMLNRTGIELNTFLHSNVPDFANENQSDGFCQSSAETSLPFVSWYNTSQKSFYDLPSFHFDVNAQLPGSGNESFPDIVENDSFSANSSASVSSKEGGTDSVSLMNLPTSLLHVSSKNGNFLANPDLECPTAGYESEYKDSHELLPCYDMNISDKEECSELVENSEMTTTSEDIQTKLDWRNIASPVLFGGSIIRNSVTSSACGDASERGFSNTSENQTFTKSSANERIQLNELDIIRPYNNDSLPTSPNEVDDLLVTASVNDKTLFRASRSRALELFPTESTSEMSTVSYSIDASDDFHNLHYSNSSTALQTDEVASVSNPDNTVYNHTKNTCALCNSNHRAASIIARTSSKAALTGTNDYLTALRDQLKVMQPQSTPNVRSGSASSVSLGYGSESSYFDESSPFSTYSESPFS